MKTTLAILLILGLPLCQLSGYAQAEAKPAASAAKAADPNEKIDIDMPNTPIDEALRGLATMAGINIDIDPKIVVATGEPPTVRAITVKYEQIQPINALLATLENHDLQLVTNAATGTFRVTAKDPKALPPLITEVFQLQYGTTNVVPVVQGTLTDARSKVLAIERTSQIVIVATEKEMEVVRTLVKDLDVAPKQVLIEAKLLETSMNPSSIRGIDWAGTLEGQNFAFGNGITTGSSTATVPGPATTTTTTLPSGATVTTTSREAQSKSTTLTSVADLIPGVTANTFNGWFPAIGILNADGVRAVLSFLNRASDTEVIATPSAVTLDNQEARLEVTRSFPIFTQNPGSAQVAATTTLTYTNVGTILIVTPRVAANSNISLRVSPEVSNIDGQNTQTIDGRANTANIYAARRITTQVMIPSGNTLVMGGLVADTSTKAYSKVPILGDAPGLGYLFRRDTKSRTKQNLLIFVTPTLVQDYDFQFTPTTFLRNSPDQLGSRPDEGPWDSGKPKHWGKTKSK